MLNYARKFSFWLPLFLVLGCLMAAHAATIAVYPGDNIQNAVNQAASGDTVFVYAGEYHEDIYMKDGVDVEGESYARVTINGKVFLKDADSALKNITVLFPESSILSYSNVHYTNWNLEADAGITAINSAPTIRNCVIKPDLDAINASGFHNPPLDSYGKAIQIWNMYQEPDILPQIEGNLIKDTDCGIYYYSQASGGAVYGEIKNNTFYQNKIGLQLRMRKEDPVIKNNIFDQCSDAAILLTYEDGTLLSARKDHILYNLFHNNTELVFVDESQLPIGLPELPSNNIEDNPLYLIITENMFYLDPDAANPALAMSDTGANVGAYPSDASAPAVIIFYPSDTDKKFMGISDLSISGQATDDVGIANVLVNAQPANITGDDFVTLLTLNYGINSINVTAYDLAGQAAGDSKEIYLFRTPIAPPAQ